MRPLFSTEGLNESGVRNIHLLIDYNQISGFCFYNKKWDRHYPQFRALALKITEPSEYIHIPMEDQLVRYFSHINQQGEIIDVRTIDSRYAKNLHNWYLRRGYDRNIRFIKYLKEKFEQEVE